MKTKDKVDRYEKANKLLRRQLAQAVDLNERLNENNRELAQRNNTLRSQLTDHTRALNVLNSLQHGTPLAADAPTILGAQPE